MLMSILAFGIRLFYIDGPLVKRSRRRPLTPQTGVRFSHGSPRRNGLHSIQKAQPFGWAFLIPFRHSSLSPQNFAWQTFAGAPLPEANGTPVWDLAPILGRSKGEEIAAWLEQHPGAGFVILDDRPDEFTGTPALKARLVEVDSMRGLRRRDFRQALDLLAGVAPGV